MISRLDEIRRILWEDWDPIGVNQSGPNDEYDSYAFQVFAMLNEGSGETQVADYLKWAATGNMGLGGAGYDDAIAADARTFAQSIVRAWQDQE